MNKTFLFWIYSSFIVTIICGLVYTAVQQNFRQTANDPQIELSEDLANAMAAGEPPQDIGNPGFDLSQSLSPFVAIYDSSGKALAFTATLDGQAPKLPAGVFDAARKNGQDRFTWQPKSGVRAAAVVTYYHNDAQKNSGFVLAGRSIKEVEKRERILTYQILAAWAFILIATFGMIWWFGRLLSPVAGNSAERELSKPETAE